MIDGKYEYFAFISYCWEDDKMAEDLQKTLEGYKFPTYLREKNPNLPTKIRPVFRDKTDLNGHRLEESLMSALESSRYLIVICSPQATKSDWVNRGIKKFIDLGREKDIIPFIVDGEANADDPKNECFPPALLSLKGERAIYGININDNGRDAAAVKVVSRMFDVKYDTLWNRFLLEKKKRRRYTIATLIAAILVVAGVAGYIWMQNQEIESQYKELQAINDKIEQQNKDIDAKSDSIINVNTALIAANDSIQRAYEKLDLSERNLAKSNADLKDSNIRLSEERDNVLKANWKMMENQARLVAEKANELMSEDNEDLTMATRLLLHVTPSSTDNTEKPFLPEVEQGLRRAYSLFNKGGTIKISNLVKRDGLGNPSVEESPIGDIIAIENGNTIDVVTLRNGRCLYTLDFHKGDTGCRFSKDGRSLFTYSADSTAAVWDTYSGVQQMLLKGHSDRVCGMYLSNSNKYYVTFTLDSCYTWNSAGELLYKLPSPSREIMRGEFSNNDEMVVMAGRGETQIIETATGRIIQKLKSDNDKWVLHARFSNDAKKVLTSSEDETATIWDIQTGKKLCSFNLGTYVLDAFFFNNEECIGAYGGNPTVYKAWTITSGEEIEYPRIGTNQTNYYEVNTFGEYVETYENDEASQGTFLKLTKMTDFKQNRKGNILAIVGQACDSILVYSYPDLREVKVFTKEDYSANVWMDFDSYNKMFASTHDWDNSLQIWDVSSGEVFSMKFDKNIDGFVGEPCFIEDDKKVAVRLGKKILIFDALTGKLLTTLCPNDVIANKHTDIWTSSIHSFVYDEKRNRIIADIYNQVIIWDVTSGNEIFRAFASTDCYSRLLIDRNCDRLITYNSCIEIWDLETMKLERTINQIDGGIYHLIQLDDNHLIACTENNSIVEINVKTGMIERELLTAHNFDIQQMDVDRNNKFLITVDNEKNILLLDIRRGLLIDKISVDELSYYAEFSKDGNAIFAPTRNGLKIIALKEIDDIISELKIKLGDYSLTPKEKKAYHLE